LKTILILNILHEKLKIMDIHEAEPLDFPTVLEKIPETVCEEESAFKLDEEVRGKRQPRMKVRPANRKRSGKRRKPRMKVRPANRKNSGKRMKPRKF
jgi:hypothetical protein